MLLSFLLSASALQAAQDPRTPYWQQQVAYDITARLDEPSGVLGGRERIRYVNRSPDTLRTFSLHLYLNAFRPGSRWADADSVEGRRRFNDLKDPSFAFNHVSDVRIMGESVAPVYPFAPDSTIVRFDLPKPLAPGDSMAVEMNWDARPSTVPRRQGRAGRRFDFAQWYPKVVVYDRHGWQEHPVYPGGEFYGEFATFLVRLDVPEDQVVGATGVPICGDPGWERANRNPSRAVEYDRNYYGERAPKGPCAPASVPTDAPGRKTIVWYAADVHHFAMSLNPDYRYEGGRYKDVAVHVLYQPGDSATWGNGVAVKRTEAAMAWLDQLYGEFAWPQLTNVHRIEGGGTEFPMMIHDGSADQGLIVHEAGHNYTMGILANNEWREGWLDEGFTSFQTSWFWEAMGRPSEYAGDEMFLLGMDLDGYGEPASLPGEDYRDFTSYNIAVYSRGELFFQQLRYVVGDAAMLKILRTFYDRWQLKHVDEAAFREVAEEVSGLDLSTFFAQWLHGTELFDYAVGKVKVRQAAGDSAGWVTRVEVLRRENGRIPVEVAVIGQSDTTVTRVDGMADRTWVEIATKSKPREVLLDPRVRAHDWNMLNNRRKLGFLGAFNSRPTKKSLDTYFSTPQLRDRLWSGLAPAAWYNDVGGITLGLRSRESYLGRYEENQFLVTRSTGWGLEDGDNGVEDTDIFLRVRNPVGLRATNLTPTFEAFSFEGRYGARFELEWARRDHFATGPARYAGVSLAWVRADDPRYLDPGYYQRAGTVELQLTGGTDKKSGPWTLSARSSIGGGLVYGRDDVAPAEPNRSSNTELYFRGTLQGIARRPLGKKVALGLRGYAGYADMDGDVVTQRRIYVAGADPYEQLLNPFLRSRGALLVGSDFNYTAPGGAGLRGFDPRLSGSYAVGVNAELERALIARPTARFFNRIAFAVFGEAAITDAAAPGEGRVLGDAGVGLRAQHRVGQTTFVTRFDLPLYVSRAELAQDRDPDSDEKFAFRWTFSFQPAF